MLSAKILTRMTVNSVVPKPWHIQWWVKPSARGETWTDELNRSTFCFLWLVKIIRLHLHHSSLSFFDCSCVLTLTSLYCTQNTCVWPLCTYWDTCMLDQVRCDEAYCIKLCLLSRYCIFKWDMRSGLYFTRILTEGITVQALIWRNSHFRVFFLNEIYCKLAVWRRNF